MCIVDWDAEGEVEHVVLYDFITPDYIGTLIYMDNSIDSRKEYYAILGQWEIIQMFLKGILTLLWIKMEKRQYA